MIRRLFSVASLMSLVLFIATALFWVYLRHFGYLDCRSYSFWLYDGIDGPVEVIGGLPEAPHYVMIHLMNVEACLLAVFAVSVLPRVMRRIQKLKKARRISMGAYPSCGYDLRGSTDRCPECGTPILVKVDA